MNPREEVIFFRQVRGVSAVVTVTFAYLRQNWRSLGKALLYIVGPVLAVQLVLSSFYQGQIFDLMNLGTGAEPIPPEEVAELGARAWLPLLLILPANLLVATLSVSVVYEHMRLYGSSRNDPQSVAVEDVWRGVKDTFGVVLGTVLLASFGAGIIVFFAFLVAATVVSGLGAGVGTGGAVLGVLLMVGVGFCAAAYLLVLVTLLFPVRMYERIGFGTALGRVQYLLRGAFWRSAGLVLLVTLLYYAVATAFGMPASIIALVGVFNAADGSGGTLGVLFHVALVVTNVLSGVGNTAGYCIPLVGAGLYYFSRVEEKERAGLAARVRQVAGGEDRGGKTRGEPSGGRSGGRSGAGSESPPASPDEQRERGAQTWAPPGRDAVASEAERAPDGSHSAPEAEDAPEADSSERWQRPGGRADDA